MKMWPTPKARDYRTASGREQRDSPDLNIVVKMWPTPAAQDAENATLPPSQIDRDTVPGSVMRQGQQDQLNPDWVECLMGFPIGWTDVERDETEAHWIDDPRWPAGPGEEQYEWEPPRVAAGVKNRVPRLKACGNAVVPAHAYPFMAAIKQIHEGRVHVG
ncbi:hypothetical protein ACI7RC_26195 [Brevibacillus sp. B_LB10_24]|uniref:hypothetical protein n=1 Tax=Brevibacillus sp. B_LB10_24 TaxID=3380645 RepID=UPI0038BABEE7